MHGSAYLHLAVDELLSMQDAELMQPTVYDTCWAARLTNEDGTPTYPHLISSILDQQHPDGSWGSEVPHIHDRLLTTLSVVLLLARFGHRRDDKRRREMGERYIWRHLDKLHQDTHPTAGFEMILPALLTEGRREGLSLPYVQLERYESERAKKLSVLPKDEISRVWTTALHSFEAFADTIDLDEVSNLLEEDGSMAASPSATACFLSRVPDWRDRYPKSAAYMDDLLQLHDGVGLPMAAPCDVFTRVWMLYYLYYGNLLEGHEETLRPHYRYLLDAWKPEGIGFSASGFPDADDTALTLLALRRAGYDIDGSSLLTYERKDHFAVYEHEVGPSVSVNLHILEALDSLPKHDRPRVRDKITRYILRSRQHRAYWRDKWHASVYYPTSRALMILPAHLPNEMDETLDYLMYTQRADGSWGQYMSTAEETAHVLLALLHYHRTAGRLSTEPMHHAARFLLDNERPFERRHPEIWSAKTLYAPVFAIRSAVLSALHLYGDTFE